MKEYASTRQHLQGLQDLEGVSWLEGAEGFKKRRQPSPLSDISTLSYYIHRFFVKKYLFIPLLLLFSAYCKAKTADDFLLDNPIDINAGVDVFSYAIDVPELQ